MFPLAALAVAIPLYFEPNLGQAQPQVRYLAAANGYTVEISDTGITMRMSGGTPLRMNLPHSTMEAMGALPGKSNYYLGGDILWWQPGVAHYARVRYRSVFRGVDLVVYGHERQIEYDWIVAPGRDPNAIRFSFTGASGLRVDAIGDLVLRTPAGEVRQAKPTIYQIENGVERRISGGFRLAGNGEVRFRLGNYDRGRPLVIDPKLAFGNSFGQVPASLSNASEFLYESTGVGLDASGNMYYAGYSSYCPHGCGDGPGPYTTSSTVFVAKLSADGSTLLYATFIGGPVLPVPLSMPPFIETVVLPPVGIAVDSQGNAYVTGATSGANFPRLGVTAKTSGGNDVFVAKLDPNGVLKAGVLFGGSQDDFGSSIALDADGGLYVTGTTQSPNFPTTAGAYGRTLTGSQDVFLMKLSAREFGSTNPLFGGSPVIYSTYLGPGANPYVAVDASGNAYIAASTNSAAWLATPGVFQPLCGGEICENVVMVKVNPTGSGLSYATYFGGSANDDVQNGGEMAGGLAIDSSGAAYITGTTSSPDFPVTSGAFQTKRGARHTAFVAKISPDATKLLYSTYVGGTTGEGGGAIAVDSSGNAYVAGATGSTDFPIANAIQTGPYWDTCTDYDNDG